MAQIPILSGIYSDQNSDLRTSLPRNLQPVVYDSGVSKGYLSPADGLIVFATGPGTYRGGINWKGIFYAVMGTKLVTVNADKTVSVLGDVGPGGWCTFDYSFDRLAVCSGTRFYYWNGTLTQVTDPDLGPVVDFCWIDGYFLTTDGVNIVQTELNDPTQVDPLKYGSSEYDPDKVVRLLKYKNELVAVNRYTIEFFQDVGGSGFAFQRIPGAVIQRGALGTYACIKYEDSIAFVGSRRNESPSVFLISNGVETEVATREIQTLLQSYTEEELATIVLDARTDKDFSHLMLHLPDKTLVFDVVASQAVGENVWFELTTDVINGSQYRAKGIVWVYDMWLFGDPQSSNIGEFVEGVSSHYGQAVGWDFSTQIIYNEGNDAIVHELELVSLPGRATFGADPVIWTSYSHDGITWSQERATKCGKQGQYQKRIAWRTQGPIRNMRIQKFRGTSDAHIAILRLEMKAEPLLTRPQ